MTMADLDPAALRSANGEKKKWIDPSASKRAFLMRLHPSKYHRKGKKRVHRAPTVKRYLKRLSEQGLIRSHKDFTGVRCALETGGVLTCFTPL
jgi:hypothetical protein